MKRIKENEYECPVCQGNGKQTTTVFENEDENIINCILTHDCVWCDGKGVVSYEGFNGITKLMK